MSTYAKEAQRKSRPDRPDMGDNAGKVIESGSIVSGLDVWIAEVDV